MFPLPWKSRPSDQKSPPPPHPLPLSRSKFEQNHRPSSSPKIRSSLLETVERAFAFYDEDNSNSIDATEVVNILRALGHDLTRGESRALLRKANVDRNGGVQVRSKNAFVFIAFSRRSNGVLNQAKPRNARNSIAFSIFKC